MAPLDSKPIPIIYIIAALVVGGAERQLYLLLKNLDRKKFSPYVISFVKGPWYEMFKSLDIPVEIIPFHKGKVRVLLLTWMRLNSFKPKIVHTIGHSANYLGRIAAVLNMVPVVIIGERTAPFIKSKVIILLDRLLAPFTTYLIANSQHGAMFYVKKKIIPVSKVSVVLNGIDVSSFPSGKGTSNRRKIGYIGDLRPVKNHEFLLRAMRLVVAEIHDAELHLAGDGPLREKIIVLSRELQIESKVIIHGWIDDIPEFLSSMDIYVQSSHYEGLPNAVMEAMSSGLPCVVLDTPGCVELIKHEVTGLVVQSDSPELLANAIVSLIKSPHLARQLGQNARKYIQKEFSINKMVSDTVEIYHKLI